MSSEEREGNDAIELLIARYLESEKNGQNLDRDGLIEEHPELADSLRAFFANHDRMKAAADSDEPTLPPTRGGLDGLTMPSWLNPVTNQGCIPGRLASKRRSKPLKRSSP